MTCKYNEATPVVVTDAKLLDDDGRIAILSSNIPNI